MSTAVAITGHNNYLLTKTRSIVETPFFLSTENTSSLLANEGIVLDPLGNNTNTNLTQMATYIKDGCNGIPPGKTPTYKDIDRINALSNEDVYAFNNDPEVAIILNSLEKHLGLKSIRLAKAPDDTTVIKTVTNNGKEETHALQTNNQASLGTLFKVGLAICIAIVSLLIINHFFSKTESELQLTLENYRGLKSKDFDQKTKITINFNDKTHTLKAYKLLGLLNAYDLNQNIINIECYGDCQNIANFFSKFTPNQLAELKDIINKKVMQQY